MYGSTCSLYSVSWCLCTECLSPSSQCTHINTQIVSALWITREDAAFTTDHDTRMTKYNLHLTGRSIAYGLLYQVILSLTWYSCHPENDRTVLMNIYLRLPTDFDTRRPRFDLCLTGGSLTDRQFHQSLVLLQQDLRIDGLCNVRQLRWIFVQVIHLYKILQQ